MYFLVAGLVLLVLKWAEIGPVATWSWWWVLSPFALAALWWWYADTFGYTKRKAMEKDEARKAQRKQEARDRLKNFRRSP
jgi:small Trp-rich protein